MNVFIQKYHKVSVKLQGSLQFYGAWVACRSHYNKMYFWWWKFLSPNVLISSPITFGDETTFCWKYSSPKGSIIFNFFFFFATKPFCCLIFSLLNTLSNNEIVLLPNVFYFYLIIFGNKIFRCQNQNFYLFFNFPY